MADEARELFEQYCNSPEMLDRVAKLYHEAGMHEQAEEAEFRAAVIRGGVEAGIWLAPVPKGGRVMKGAEKGGAAGGGFWKESARESRYANRMKPGHVFDKRTIDAVQDLYGLSYGQRRKMHQMMEGKPRGETLSWDDLCELAERVKKLYPNL